MTIFPRIQRPCPYKSKLSDIMDGDTCRLCQRKVHDLTALSGDERVAFFDACSGDVCVSYAVLVPAIAAAATVAAFGMPVAAAAQDLTLSEEVIMVGGVSAANVEYVADPNAVAAPDLPVVYAGEGNADDNTGVQPEAPAASTTDSGSDLSHAVESE